jgi:hypothetical protein
MAVFRRKLGIAEIDVRYGSSGNERDSERAEREGQKS